MKKNNVSRVFIKGMSVLLAAGMLTACGSGAASSTGSSSDATPATAASESAPAPEADAARKSTANTDERYAKVTIALSSDPQDLAPTTLAGDNSKQYIYNNIYEPLFDFDGGDYTPILAKTYTEVDDTHWQVQIYDNIYDTAGNQITADDVVFSVNALVESGNAFKYDIFDSIKKVDDYTVEYTWTTPVTEVGALEWPWCRTWIVSQKSYEEIGGFADAPIGTGPYKVTEFVSGAHVTLEANDAYWQTDELRDPHHEANVQTIEYDIIAETSQHVIALGTNQVQYSEYVPAENLADFQEGGQYAAQYGVSITQGSQVNILQCNTSEGNICNDINFRNAVFYGIDNEAIAAVTGTCLPCKAFGTPFFSDYYASWEEGTTYINTYDPELARQYLEKTAYNGETLVLEGDSSEVQKSMMTMIQTLLLNIGIKVEISSKESALVQTDITNPDAWDMLIWNIGGGTQIGEWNRPINYNEFGTGFNMAFLHDETLQTLLTTCATVDGHTEENMTEMHKYIIDNAYYTALSMPQINAVYDKSFATLTYRENEFLLPGACEYYLD